MEEKVKKLLELERDNYQNWMGKAAEFEQRFWLDWFREVTKLCKEKREGKIGGEENAEAR